MKTRTNQPVLEYVVEDITKMSDTLLNQLQCGDRVSKLTGKMKHNYIVTYKEELHGICLSYYACGYLETISYDYNTTTKHWVYNSKDVMNIEDYEKTSDLEDDVKDVIEGAESGTISDVLGLDSEGGLVKGNISVGTKLYKHTITFTGTTYDSESLSANNMVIISTIGTKITDVTTFNSVIKNGFISDVNDLTFEGSNCFMMYGTYSGYLILKSGSYPYQSAPMMSFTANDTVTPL